MILNRISHKRNPKKNRVAIPGWVMDLFNKNNLDTSGYIIDTRLPRFSGFGENGISGIPPPDTGGFTMAAEPMARSPSLETEIGFEVTTENSPLYAENGPDPPKEIEYTSGPDPPNHSKAKIRSPSQWITISDYKTSNQEVLYA